MSENKRRDSMATAGVGLAGVAGGAALRQKGLQRAHFEDTKTPIRRPKLGAERQLLRGARGRRTWLAGALMGTAALPATAVGLHGTAQSMRKRDESSIARGLRGAADALEDRVESQREAPPRLTARNIGATTGASLAGGGLAAMAMRGKKVGPLARSAGLATAGTATGAATVPVQAKYLERKTGGEYTVTPVGVRRKKRSPKRPSHDATMIDTKSGQVTPAGVRKADDPGARLSRIERRALVTGAGGLPIPVVGDMAQAGAAGKLAAPPYRKRTSAEVFASNQAGNLTGAAAGGLGAAHLANRSARAADAMNRANTRVGQAKGKVASVAPQQARDAYTGARTKARSAMPAGGSGMKRLANSKTGRLLAAHKGPATFGALAGGIVGGQSAMHAAYTHSMNRDDRYRNANRLARRGTSKVEKKNGDLSRKERSDLSYKKRKQAALSVISGGAGIGALAATGLTAGAPRLPKGSAARRVANKIVPHAEKAKTPLLSIGAGVGGYGSMNFAGLQRQEAKNLDEVKKALVRVPRGPRRTNITSGHLRRTRTFGGPPKTISVRGSTR